MEANECRFALGGGFYVPHAGALAEHRTKSTRNKLRHNSGISAGAGAARCCRRSNFLPHLVQNGLLAAGKFLSAKIIAECSRAFLFL